MPLVRLFNKIVCFDNHRTKAVVGILTVARGFGSLSLDELRPSRTNQYGDTAKTNR